MYDAQENPFPYSLHEIDQVYNVGGEDPDFVPDARMTPFLCTIPVLRRMLTRCRPVAE